MANVQDIKIGKLDYHRGDPSKHVQKVVNNDDDEDEDDDDDDFDDDDVQSTKTAEGGLIMALLNMQLKPLIKDYLPEIKIDFDSKMAKDGASKVDALRCYGIQP